MMTESVQQGTFSSAEDPEGDTPSVIFDLVWTELVQILGSPATAAMLRRCTKKGVEEYPELKELLIVRRGFEYEYTVPAAWKELRDKSKALQRLLHDLDSLLIELTGVVVVQRLRSLPQLATYQMASSEGAQ